MAARGHTIMRREPACVGGTVVRGPAQQARWRLALLSWSSPSLPSRCRRAPCLSPLCPPPPPPISRGGGGARSTAARSRMLLQMTISHAINPAHSEAHVAMKRAC